MRDAHLLKRELRKHYHVWLDSNELTGGIHLRDTVFAAIDNADMVLFPLHKGDLRDFTVEGDFFKAEMEHTFAKTKDDSGNVNGVADLLNGIMPGIWREECVSRCGDQKVIQLQVLEFGVHKYARVA
jgi:hypothetical protein